jgi:hypothetical protein
MQTAVNLWPLLGVAVIAAGFLLRANPVLVLLLPLAVPGLLFAEAGIGKAVAQVTTAWRCQSCRHGCHWHVQRVLRHLNDADGGEL